MTIHCRKPHEDDDGYTLCGRDYFNVDSCSHDRFTDDGNSAQHVYGNGDRYCKVCSKAASAAANEAKRNSWGERQ